MYENEPEWNADEAPLFDASMKSIAQFVEQKPDAVVSFFAFDCDPSVGQVLLCFDTLDHSRRFVKDNIAYRERRRSTLGNKPEEWEADWYSLSVSLPDYCDSLGDFSYQGFEILDFAEWRQFSESNAYEHPTIAGQPDYVKARIALLFWRVLKKLVATDAFAGLTLAAPFRLGYGFHDSGLITLMLLNQPEQVIA